jgi:hypothetical protein
MGTQELHKLSLQYPGKNLDTTPVPCYQFYLTERSFTKAWSILRQAQDRWGKGHRAIQQNFSYSMLCAPYSMLLCDRTKCSINNKDGRTV